jgi:hypothetical protein
LNEEKAKRLKQRRRNMKIKCLFLTALLLAVTSIGFAQSKTNSTSGIRKVDFKNFNYGEDCNETILSSEDELILKKGHQGDKGDTAWADLSSVKYVDFDGDGKEEAFVVIDGQSGGSQGVYLAAYVFADQKGSAKKIWSYCFERSGVKLQGKTIIFRRPDWLKDEPSCCPSRVSTETFAWKRSKIALISTKISKYPDN